MVVDTGGVFNVSKSQDTVMEELAITTTIGMDGFPLAAREAAVARMPSMIERQATAAVEESSVIIFLVDGQFHLIDAAGIRKRAAIASAGSTTEALSVNQAFRAIRRPDVVALVIEAMACITEQDYKIAERIEQEGKGCVIVVNKWDTIQYQIKTSRLQHTMSKMSGRSFAHLIGLPSFTLLQ
ncbi:hypothetical protein RJT34_30099 [Clitoria ternatea]|uniref:G domain-containing protein n=1 Tax=Clitoria ternatea TaxID=43366 RepID=A0AAN9I3R3_CLITE